MRRDVYNDALMRSSDYTNPEGIKRLIASLSDLEKLSYRGDQAGLAIMVDIKTVLGMYGMDKTILTKRQVDAIILNLIYGYTQEEIGKMWGITQRAVGYIINQGINRIITQLEKGYKEGLKHYGETSVE